MSKLLLTADEYAMLLSRQLTSKEKQALLMMIVVEPEDIEGFEPQSYRSRNTRTGRVREYFACSAERALALAYMDQGWEDELVIETP